MQRKLIRIFLPLFLFGCSILALEAQAQTTAITNGSISFASNLSNADNRFFLQGDGLSLNGRTRPSLFLSSLMIDTNVTHNLTFVQRPFDGSDDFSFAYPITINGRTYDPTTDPWRPQDDALFIQLSGSGVFPDNPTSDVVTISLPFTITGFVSKRHLDGTMSNRTELTGSGIATAVYTHGPLAPTLWSLKKVTYKFNSTGGNPIDQTDFFIQQHYIDFLDRYPEDAGFTGWQNILNNCGKTVAQPCDRIEVSSDFFRSVEFQERGYFVYLFYSTLGQITRYDQFVRDYQLVNGFGNMTEQEFEASKASFANQFITRTDYVNKYGSITDPTNFVNALLQTVGLPDHPQRSAWINGLTNATMSRAAVLRALVESPELRQKYYNEAFVVMQYFGYLRRDPDILYLKWIETLNKTGDYRTMINGFLNSTEYRQRFGS